jgi:hypothetical protein
MTKPVRIQRKRTKGWKMPENTIYVGRPTPMGNPLRAGMWRDYTAAAAVADYRRYIERDTSVRSFEGAFGKPPTLDEIRSLRGFNLCCWCALDQPCHADILLEIANGGI